MKTKKTKETSLRTSKKTNKNTHSNAIFHLIIKLISILVVLFLAFMLYNTASKTKTKYSAIYKENGGIDYKVYLKENNYYKEKYLDKEKVYIASLIDYIDIDCSYNFNMSRLLQGDYQYDIKASLIISEKSDTTKVLYQNDETLIPNRIINLNNQNSVNILENIKIDYAKYNDLVNSFKKDYLLSVSSQLILTFNISLDSSITDMKQEFKNVKQMTMTIPLSEQTIDINMTADEVNHSGELSEFSTNEILNTIYYTLSGICCLIAFVLLFKTFKYYKKMRAKVTKYNQILHKILKEYDRAIVTMVEMTSISEKEVVCVEKFEELLDVSDRIEKPINFFESQVGVKSYFFVIDESIIYEYVLKASDVNNVK